METHIDTSLKAAEVELSQEFVDEQFEAMVPIMEDLYELDQRPVDYQTTTHVELEAIRDGLLGELLEKAPHEAIAEVVHSIALLYEARTIEYRRGDATVRSFATRDANGTRLDDHFNVINHDDGRVDIECTFMPFSDMGYGVQSFDHGAVHTYTKTGSYTIPTSGKSNHEERIREFYLRTLTTAGHALHRRETDPAAADLADRQARQMLYAELFPAK